jgi:hypothetical protein
MWALLFLLLVLLPLGAASRTSLQRTLVENYDDGSEMNMEIIRDYMQSEECLRRCAGMGEKALLDSFEDYRAVWVDRMVSFVIGELKLDADSAKSIRKNPASYMINYETFKLLAFR